MTRGDRVRVVLPDDHPLYATRWWPARSTRVTGTVGKVFKNGKVGVDLDQVRTWSGPKRLHFTMNELVQGDAT